MNKELRVHYGHHLAPVACGNTNPQRFSLDRDEVTCMPCRTSSQFDADFFNHVEDSMEMLDDIVEKVHAKNRRRSIEVLPKTP